jgi:hypothetical protein
VFLKGAAPIDAAVLPDGVRARIVPGVNGLAMHVLEAGEKGAGGLSRRSVKLVKAGVAPERIAPGKLQQNGRQERRHLRLLREAATPPAP